MRVHINKIFFNFYYLIPFCVQQHHSKYGVQNYILSNCLCTWASRNVNERIIRRCIGGLMYPLITTSTISLAITMIAQLHLNGQ